MSVLYSNSFESETHVTAVSGFTALGGTSAFIAIDQGSFGAMPAARGVKSYAQNDHVGRNYWSGGSAIGDQGMRTASYLIAGHYIGHMLRVDSAASDKSYWFYYTLSAGNLTANIAVRDGGEAAATSGGSVAASAGDIVHMESLAIGTALEMRVWTNSNARPSTATLSWTRSDYSTGKQGLVKLGTSGTYASADDLVIADGATGLDLFYPGGGSSGGPAPFFNRPMLGGNFQG
jgi:hypothetical protein